MFDYKILKSRVLVPLPGLAQIIFCFNSIVKYSIVFYCIVWYRKAFFQGSAPDPLRPADGLVWGRVRSPLGLKGSIVIGPNGLGLA